VETDLIWQPGDTANYAIGQGFLTATPLQVLWSASIVAWHGSSYKPKLLYGKQADNRMVSVSTGRPDKKPLTDETLSALRQCMRAAVTEGTCKPLNLPGLEVGAKTGTAETGIRGQDDHSWVVGYFPVSKPKYGFVVFVENGGSSHDAAIPLALDLLRYIKRHPIIAPSATNTAAAKPSGK
jgi:penicillin-binding protein 2